MSNVQAPLTPEVFIRESILVLPGLTSAERNGLLEQAMAWATVYHDGDVPYRTTHELKEMEMQCRLLMTRDGG